MVDNTVDIITLDVINDTLEHILDTPFSRLFYIGPDMLPLGDPGLDTNSDDTRTYAFSVVSAGSASAGTQRINYRSVSVDADIPVGTPMIFPNFITNVTIVKGTTDLFIFPRSVTSQRIIYDIFVTYVGAVGATDLTLTFVSGVVPPLTILGPVTTNIAALQKIVPRQTQGNTNVFDYFLLD